MSIPNRFVRERRPSDDLRCTCGSLTFNLGVEVVRLVEVAEKIYIARPSGETRELTELEGVVKCTECGLEYGPTSRWD